MKKFTCIFCLLVCFSFAKAQETMVVNGEPLELKQAVDGQLDLFWTIVNRDYRFFVRQENGELTELFDTDQNNYKLTLSDLTNATVPTSNVKFTRSSLKDYIDIYNGQQNSDYVVAPNQKRLKLRVGIFGGITNSPFITNPDNESTPLFGGELEVLDINEASRHALFLQLKHVLEQDYIKYSTTEIALGYRFRAINKKCYSLYGNMKFATLNFSNAEVTTIEDDSIISEEFSETSFDIPFIFGIGADIRVTENSFVTLAYNELFAIFLDNKGNFSTNFTVGYKINL
ncbi:hypothetical protein [Psychroserpens sp.]|uniref:hypothetical protein n=1 Tax=Psychroserpens sp. TaxID=2020870 RepID=UPI003C791DF2